VSFYEERLLFLLQSAAANPRARNGYASPRSPSTRSSRVLPAVPRRDPASHARSRLTLLCADDASPRSLTEKILERPRLIERIRAGIMDPSKPNLTVFNSTPHERKLAVLLGRAAQRLRPAARSPGHEVGEPEGLPRGGVDSRRASRTCTRPHDVEEALAELRGRGRGSGGSHQARRELLRRGQRAPALPRVGTADRRCVTRCSRWSSRWLRRTPGPTSTSCRRWRHRGGVHRGRGEAVTSASCGSARAGHPRDLHPRPDPRRAQRPGLPRLPLPGSRRLPDADPGGGSEDRRCPRRARRRQPLRRGLPRLPRRPGRRLEAQRPRDQPPPWGHDPPLPRPAVLTGGSLDRRPGSSSLAQRPRKYYKATDNLFRSSTGGACCRRTSVESWTVNKLHQPRRESGVLFNLIGALSEFGKLGDRDRERRRRWTTSTPTPSRLWTARRRTGGRGSLSIRGTRTGRSRGIRSLSAGGAANLLADATPRARAFVTSACSRRKSYVGRRGGRCELDELRRRGHERGARIARFPCFISFFASRPPRPVGWASCFSASAI